jgi:hypothetical protein
MNKFIVVDHFIENLDLILQDIYKIKLYSQEEYNKLFNTNQTWPGFRSEDIYKCFPTLLFFCLESFYKLNLLKKEITRIESHIHLRTKEFNKSDWVHKDSCKYTLLVYLNNSNLNSGTYFYDEEKNTTCDIKYLKNRAVLFNSDCFHMGYGHFGDNNKNGRLTLNFFIS